MTTQTSNAVAIKQAIIVALAAAPGLSAVDVGYSWNRDMGREVVYGGAVSVQQMISGGRGATGNATRDETVTINLHVRVGTVGLTVEEAELRTLVIGAELEAYLAVNLPVVTGLLAVELEGYDLVSSFDDDGGFTLATYPVRASSYLS